MDQYKDELKAILRALSEVSMELLEAEVDTSEYKDLIAELSDLLRKIQTLEDRRRRAFFQTEEENDDREEDQ
ncbi:MAG: hypothetical protein IJ042_09755 [Butyricicoccus sp.]|nr:hypothetical protein [Butyricicoccus sp.]